MPPSTDYAMTVPADVLIVDDMPINLQLLAAYLKAAGHNVRAVPRGDLALNAVANAKPDIILLDVMMPRMSGYEVAEHLQADPNTAGIPIVFISGLSDEGFKKQAFHRGAVDYIVKPFKRDDVLSCVKKHVEAARHKQSSHTPEVASAQPGASQPGASQPGASQPGTSPSGLLSTAARTVTESVIDAPSQAQHMPSHISSPNTNSPDTNSPDTSSPDTSAAASAPKLVAGLATRNTFDDLLTQAWQRKGQQAEPVGLMVIAVDNQTRLLEELVNNSYDELLEQLVSVLQNALVGNSTLCRYDAHSFAVVLENTPLAAVMSMAEQACSSVAAHTWTGYLPAHLAPTMSVSIGVASSETLTEAQPDLDSNPDSNPDQARPSQQLIVQVAHQQLQRAQTQGGNRVCSLGL
ncbi:MAG: response regulator [Deinococcota bacterium]